MAVSPILDKNDFYSFLYTQDYVAMYLVLQRIGNLFENVKIVVFLDVIAVTSRA